MVNPVRTSLLLCIATFVPLNSATGQTPYKLPPRDVVAILDAPPPPLSIVSPTRDTLLLIEIQPYPSIEVVAEPILRLAGLRINPRIGSLQRLVHYTGLSLQPLDGSPRPHPCHREPIHGQNGPIGKKIAFARDIDDGIEFWIADAATGQSRPIAGAGSTTCSATQSTGCPITAISWQSSCPRVEVRLQPRREPPLAPMCRKAPALEPDGHVPRHAHQSARRRPLSALRDRPARSD